MGPEEGLTSCDLLVGSPVVDRLGAQLGVVTELVLDVESGRVAYALIARRRQGAEEAEEHVVVPWGALRVDRGRDRLELAVERRRFDEAPGIPSDETPELGDPDFEREVVARFQV
jgi:hypothetical protein